MGIVGLRAPKGVAFLHSSHTGLRGPVRARCRLRFTPPLFLNPPPEPTAFTVADMIPQFPEFKKIELADLNEVEQITKQFPPYSDYNFISLWSWDTNGRVYISKLNGNLVVRFTDYLTCKPFYSFLGANSMTDTAQKLLCLSDEEGFEPVLKLLPEIAVKNIDVKNFRVIEDRDSYDYIYEISTFLLMDGPKFHHKRRQCKYFEKTYTHTVMELDITNPIIKDQIIDLCHDWVRVKIENVAAQHFQNEFLSILRYLMGVASKEHIAVGILVNNRLIAVSISENTCVEHNTCHFQKALTDTYKGLNVFLVREVAKILAAKGIRYINWEQDMGIPGLRESKESFQPSMYLKKYSLSTCGC